MDNLFILAIVQLLGIKKPVEIRLRPAAKHSKTLPRSANNKSAAWCETRVRNGNPVSFVIFVNLDICFQSRFPINDVIAHELVHAVMIENGVFKQTKHHCERFQKICKHLEKEMKKAGFKIGKLYNPLTDTE